MRRLAAPRGFWLMLMLILMILAEPARATNNVIIDEFMAKNTVGITNNIDGASGATTIWSGPIDPQAGRSFYRVVGQ